MDKAVIKALMVRDKEKFDYAVVEVLALKYDESGEVVGFYNSAVNPMTDPGSLINLPKPLISAVPIAPSLVSVVEQIKKFVKGCEIAECDIPEILKKALV